MKSKSFTVFGGIDGFQAIFLRINSERWCNNNDWIYNSFSFLLLTTLYAGVDAIKEYSDAF